MTAYRRGTVEPADSVAGSWRQVHLVGFMGAGKSTVGRLLARRLLWNYLDLDALVERHAESTVAEIFAREGEDRFREHERWALRQAVQKPRTVLALGGGTFVDAENVALCRAHGVSVWLRCGIDVVTHRLQSASSSRPLWDPERAAELMARRAGSYARADLRVDAEAAPAVVVERVLEALTERVEREAQ